MTSEDIYQKIKAEKNIGEPVVINYLVVTMIFKNEKSIEKEVDGIDEVSVGDDLKKSNAYSQ